MSDSDYRTPAKRWRRRNSDFRDTFEGITSEPTASIVVEEHALPMSESQRIAGREDLDEYGVAERHVHEWSVEEPE